jgi:hypothetical protein
MISSNTTPPGTFGGYITWTVHAPLDARYLKCTTNSAVVGTVQAQAVLAHTHTSGTLVTAAG